MMKASLHKYGPLQAVLVLLLCLITAVFLLPAKTQGGTGVPLPIRKPVSEARAAGPFQYASSLLSFGSNAKGADLIFSLTKRAATQTINSGPLSKSDAALYKEVFALQSEGNFKEADIRLKKISDLRLLGHVLSQRYLHDDYKSGFAELQNWLAHYNDHPEAERIYRLASARAPKDGNKDLVKPTTTKKIARVHEPTMRKAKTYTSSKSRSGDEQARVRAIKNKIEKLIDVDRMNEGLKLLESKEVAGLLDNVEYDQLRARLASAYLYFGMPKTAFPLAVKSVERSGKYVPTAAWVAGLVSWRANNYGDAAHYFEIVAGSPYASGWLAASSAYWTARANMRLGNVKAVSKWLSVGMENPRTFYGLLSTRALGRDFDFNWRLPTFTAGYRDVLAAIPAGARAIALVEAGQSDLAQSELLRVNPQNEDERNALLAYAGYANLPGLGMRMASALANAQNTYDGALYPIGPWQPQSGFKVDPALLHAIMRQESRFDPEAESASGAMGLMQLMPATAKRMADGDELDLEDPELNLEIGQRYVERLMKNPAVKGDLFSLMIAYNAGPGNLAKWKKRWPDVKDPLLFIELIPSGQTRNYVEHVLANYWIYRMKDDKDVPSLDAVASGQTPHYSQTAL